MTRHAGHYIRWRRKRRRWFRRAALIGKLRRRDELRRRRHGGRRTADDGRRRHRANCGGGRQFCAALVAKFRAVQVFSTALLACNHIGCLPPLKADGRICPSTQKAIQNTEIRRGSWRQIIPDDAATSSFLSCQLVRTFVSDNRVKVNGAHHTPNPFTLPVLIQRALAAALSRAFFLSHNQSNGLLRVAVSP